MRQKGSDNALKNAIVGLTKREKLDGTNYGI